MFKYILISVMLLSIYQIAYTENPSASDLLNKYSATRDKYSSFISKTENTVEFELSPTGSNARFSYTHQKNYSKIDFRYDGKQRSNVRTYSWGDVSQIKTNVPEKDPLYTSRLRDVDLFIGYGRGNLTTDPGKVDMNKNVNPGKHAEQSLARAYKGHETLGYLYGDDERMDVVLKQAANINVRDNMDVINGSKCYIIDAQTKRGQYSIWIDPNHGYNIAKAEVTRKEGDLRNENDPPVAKGDQEYTLLSNVKFKQIDDVWIPMEANIYHRQNLSTLFGYNSWEKIAYKVTEFLVNPDHEALGSFKPDDIQNGAIVNVLQYPGIHYTWQDGKLVPNVDLEVIAEIDKMADDIFNDNKKTEIADITTETVKSIIGKYAANQDKLKSFIAKADSQIEYPGSTKTSEKEQSEFRTDGDKVNLRNTNFDNSQPAKINQYSSYLWNGQSMIQYSKNSVNIQDKTETNKKRIISQNYKGGSLLGYFGGELERIDYILSKADSSSVQPKMELINDSQCFLVEAKTKTSNYKVWFDPQHGYNIAQLEMRRDANTGVKSFSLQNINFEQIDNVWVPMEADMQQAEQKQTVKWHHKRTQMLVNPDHNKLASFVADDIPAGTKVRKQNDSAEYIWKNGKAVQSGR